MKYFSAQIDIQKHRNSSIHYSQNHIFIDKQFSMPASLPIFGKNMDFFIGIKLGDNCIQNFHFGRYIVGYTVGNLVLRRRASVAVKCGFRTYIRRYTSPNENSEYSCPHSNAFLQFRLKLECCNPYKAACHPTICDVTNDVKLLQDILLQIFDVIQSNVALLSKCIRISNICLVYLLKYTS